MPNGTLFQTYLLLPVQDLDTIYEQLWPGIGLVLSILIVLATVFKWYVETFSQLGDAVDNSQKIFQRLRFWKKPTGQTVLNKPQLYPGNLMTKENPKGKYVDDNDNLSNLGEIIENNQLINVTGPSGIGKTRLVQEVCTVRLKDRFQLVIEVDFESLQNGEIEDMFAHAQGILNRCLNNDRKEDYFFIAKNFQSPTIFFFDHYDHVKLNYGLHVKIYKELIEPFLTNPNIKVIITSQVKINFVQVIYELEGLSNVRSIDGRSEKDLTSNYGAIKLFCRLHNDYVDKFRKKARKSFTLEQIGIIADLCNQVSNNPLGIRLLACKSVEYELKTIQGQFTKLLQKEIIPLYGELSERHLNMYTAFKWNYDTLGEEEKLFFYHLSFFKNGFYLRNIPHWPQFNDYLETTETVKKFYNQSLLRETIDPDGEEERYEIYVLFKENVEWDMKSKGIAYDKTYLLEICHNYHTLLQKIHSWLFDKDNTDLDNRSISALKNDALDIEGMIKWCTDNANQDLALDLLVLLEKILNEVGPYVISEKLYDGLLDHFKSGKPRARLLMSKARLLKSSKSRDLSPAPIREALQILAEQTSIDKTTGEIYRIGANLSGELAEFDIGESIIEKTMAFSPEEIEKIGMLNYAFVILEMARAQERKGNFDLAAEHFEQSKTLMTGYPLQQARACNYTALFYWRRGKFDKAEKHLKQAIVNYTGIGEDRWILGFKTNLGLLYSDMADLEESLKYTNETHDALKLKGPYSWFQINKINKGRIYARKPKTIAHFQTAEALLLDSYAELTKIKYWESAALASIELADLYYKYNRPKDATEFCHTTLSLCEDHDFTRYMRYYRALCLLGLMKFEDGLKDESNNYLLEAEEVHRSVDKNAWLSYELTKIRYNQLKKYHSHPL
ncbi:tetratricopeptide repeat protein [Pseudozobellia thermophila]|uniref:Tetratricopeptide repeat-containing protein n=1 Tax=Pseudozobellia thermophila TaxID=192903 RepID=A0A1M6KUQ0_9FLAO|nr:tetratricopeptide repeat protein [Pseudozobellia thermophila]SHJ62707.1 hypothetical protein SAMN04488513_106203 [Pseudozobellia thermophila]